MTLFQPVDRTPAKAGQWVITLHVRTMDAVWNARRRVRKHAAMVARGLTQRLVLRKTAAARLRVQQDVRNITGPAKTCSLTEIRSLVGTLLRTRLNVETRDRTATKDAAEMSPTDTSNL
jgi:hypothetical protein